MSFDTLVHLFAGGLGGTLGAVATCPLEVVKTRLQSSMVTFQYNAATSSTATTATSVANGPSVFQCLRHIVQSEGPRALFKGLAPNLIGVAPSRAIYFCTYSQVKTFCNTNHRMTPDTPYVHMISAGAAGFVSSTITNPVWFVKTRMQLDVNKYGSPTAWQTVQTIYQANGIGGFFKGITASYYGISETIIHFVIYEFIKTKFHQLNVREANGHRGEVVMMGGSTVPASANTATIGEPKLNFFQYMAAAAASKSFASFIAYPHEVARTRLREEGHKYRGFFQTLLLVYREEGIRHGLYRGLCTQLLRQVPNTAIMMGTYEVVVYFMKSF